MSEINPITREEMFLAAASGQNIQLPEPITRVEMFLAKIAAGGGSGGANIHVGPDAPTDGSNVWIDTDEEADEPGGSGSCEPADWNASEGEPGYVKNRTHWKEEIVTTILPQADFRVSSGWYDDSYGTDVNEPGSMSSIGDFVKDQKYLVTFDGTDYECIGTELTYSGETVVGIGNPWLIEETGWGDARFEDNGLPFWIEMFAYEGSKWGAILYGQDATISLEIKSVSEVVHKLPEKYLPEFSSATPDWSATEGQPGHVLNRTHWVEVVDTEVANGEYTSFVMQEIGVYGCFVPYNVEVEKIPDSVSVTFDGVEYKNLKPTEITGFGVLAGNLFYMNALMGTSFENTGEPFLAYINELNSVTLLMLDTEATVHTIKIVVPLDTYRPFDYRFLSDGEVEFTGVGNNDRLNTIKLLKKGISVNYQNERYIYAVDEEGTNGRTIEKTVMIDGNGGLFGKRSIYSSDGSIESEDFYGLSSAELVFHGHSLGYDEKGRPYVRKHGASQRTWEPDVLTSPSGKKFRLTVDDNGTITATEVT